MLSRLVLSLFSRLRSSYSVLLHIFHQMKANARKPMTTPAGTNKNPGNAIKIALPPKIARLIDAQTNEHRAYRNEREREDRQKTFREWATIFLLLLTFGAAFASALVFQGQLIEMRKVYGPVKQSADATKDAADAATDQVGILKGQLDAMERDQTPYVSRDDKTWGPIFKLIGPGTGKIFWEWHFMNFGRGMATNVKGEHFLRIGKNGTFKRPPGNTGSIFAGDLPFGVDKVGVTISDPITEDDFKKLTLDNSIGLLLEFQYSSITQKPFTTKVYMAGLPGINNTMIRDPAECEKSKEN